MNSFEEFLKDVLKDTKSSYYNNLNRRSPIVSPRLQRNKSATSSRKSLPPLDPSKSFDSSFESRSELRLDTSSDIININVSNKKKSPDKIISIDQTLLSHTNFRESDTPVTIDIISDSGRYSRQSLDPLTSRESNSRYSSRPSSVKETSIRKTSAKLTPVQSFNQSENMIKFSERPIVDKNDRLDTIKESITETLRINVKKLDLNPAKCSDNKTKPVTSILKKPSTLIQKSPIKPPDNLKLQLNNNNNNIISNSNNNNNNKKILTMPPKPITNRSQSTDKSPKVNNVKNVSLNNVSKTEPTRIETSRIEKNKKVQISPIETPSDVFNESFQSTFTNVTSASKSTICPPEEGRLEICSSRININEKPQSAKSITSIGEPKQPLISTMFEGYPQPYHVPNVESKKTKPKTSSAKKSVSSKFKVKSSTNKQITKKPSTKKETNKILISLASQDIDINLQKEIDESLQNDNYESEFDDDNVSISSKNSINYLSDNEKDISEIKLDEPAESLKAKATQIAIATDPNNKENDQQTSRINKDFVKSFEDRVFAIYTKFDNLLMQQQENKEKIDILNNQKAQFSEEIAKELKDNIDFDEDDKNSDYKRLKDLYDLVKKNSSDNKNETNEPKVTEKPPLPDKEINLTRVNSIKSNADIREVFTMVNSMGNKNSIKSNNTAELTIIPNNRMSRTFKLPVNISDKINTLMVSLPNAMPPQKNDDESETSENFKIDSKNKFINVNKLDSIGNESRNSSESFDSNSISYHYDLKYKNDRSKSPINLQIESENDFQFKWKRGNLLGKGAFGSVYQAMLSTGEIIAVKQIEMEESDPVKARKEYDSVREEVKILRELEHINIVQFMGTMLVGNVVNIFMELIPGGTIETLLKTFGPFEEELFKIFANQIVEGVNYLHSCNVVHRDIKGKNIMLMSNGVIKLIDFGCAKRLRKNQSSNSIKQLLKSLKGTPYWMSPEVIRETGHGAKADIWSLGATVFEMAVGMPPWGELSPLSAIYAIGSGETPVPELPDKYSQEAKDFVKRCLTRDPELRPNAADLLNHDFLRQNSQ